MPKANTDNGLTPKQERFALEWIGDQNGAQAAIRAGYAESSARVTASQLLAKPNIKKRVAELQAGIQERTEVDATLVVRMLKESYKDAKEANQHAAAVRCIELMGKTLGIFTDVLTVKDEIEKASDAELADAMTKELGISKAEALAMIGAEDAGSAKPPGTGNLH